jgi:O-antigen ligase
MSGDPVYQWSDAAQTRTMGPWRPRSGSPAARGAFPEGAAGAAVPAGAGLGSCLPIAKGSVALMQANFFATFSLAAYPLFILTLFVLYRPPIATALSLLVAEMFLPPFYSLPLSTPTWLNKATIPPLATLLIVPFFARSYLRRSRPFRGIEWFFVAMVVGTFMTMWTNRDSLQYGPTVIPGEKFGDFTSSVMRSLVDPWIAFYLGRVMFKTSRDLNALCRMLVLAAVVYTIPALYEIRMSPQLQASLYGYAPDVFAQSIRWGGYRPSVFFGHGLGLAMFMLICFVVSVALTRAKMRVSVISTKTLCIYLGLVLVLCKSTGAIIYAAVALPILVFSSSRTILRIASILAIFFVVYPLLRFADVIPTKQIGDYFVSISPERAQSLSYRFEMEQGMLDLTRQRPWFGWGGYARNFVYDPVTGGNLTVPDGMVILTLSVRGLVGFFVFFAPYVVSVLRAVRLVKKVRDRSDRLLLCGFTLVCSIILFDLIINSSFPPIYVLLLGALYGLPSGIIAEEDEAQTSTSEYREFEEVPA